MLWLRSFCLKVMIFSVCIFACSCAHDWEPSTISEQTYYVYRRFYFIARLHKTIELLTKIYQGMETMQDTYAGKKLSFDEIVPEQMCQLFTHKQIRDSAKAMVQTKSLKPLFMVWDSFKAYKSLHDDLLVEEFSKEIFIITKNTVASLHKKNVLRKIPFLDDVRVESMSDIHLTVQTDEVAYRYYYIQRLKGAAELLLTAKHRSDALQNFAHEWDNITQYKQIDNESYVHAAAVHALALLYDENQITVKTALRIDFDALCHALEQMPLEDILQTIDVVVKQMQVASTHYNNSGLHLKEWLQYYWWAPVAIGITFVVKCFMLFYKHAIDTGLDGTPS